MPCAKMLLVLLARVPVELVKEISNWANDYNLRSNMAHIPHLHVHLEMYSEYESYYTYRSYHASSVSHISLYNICSRIMKG